MVTGHSNPLEPSSIPLQKRGQDVEGFGRGDASSMKASVFPLALNLRELSMAASNTIRISPQSGNSTAQA